jgi:hypothetical protein
MSARTAADAELFVKVIDALFDMLATRVDVNWGNETHATMLSAGLTAVHTTWFAETWVGGTYGCLLAENNVTQKRDELTASGLTTDEIDRFTKGLMHDPELVVRSYEFASVRGQRPA